MSDTNNLTVELMRGAVDRHRKRKLRDMLVGSDSLGQAEEAPLADDEMRQLALEMSAEQAEDEDEEEA